MTDRRDFLRTSVAIGGALGLVPTALFGAQDPFLLPPPVPKAPASLNILILGGTGFTGPEQVEYALARGHRVTLFNRNRTRPDFFKGKVAEELVGDLNNDTSALKGKQFDVVLDNPTTFPAWVRNAAQQLRGNVKHYIFQSTTSVYSDQSIIGLNENSPVAQLPADVDPYTLVPQDASRHYGALKVRAEQEVAKQYPGISTVVRPCLIVGPLDRTDRFTYWPARIDAGGEILAPDKPEDPCQFIDVRDLAEFSVRLAEARAFGTYNVIGPEKPMTIGEMLYGVKAITATPGRFTWVPWPFLQEQGIRPWRHMTVWQPPYGATAGYQRRNAAKAIAAGLTFRSLADTARTTLAWHRTRPQAEQEAILRGAVNGLDMKREAEVLAAWYAKAKGAGEG
ncbi:MAG: NAD-dependent epimerase/dehydratase family protein [Gemmatimonadetes bacterium]|nr:NAD-dependent epimerase/dehydratase family protein [Gemmatimonadota bacterium]